MKRVCVLVRGPHREIAEALANTIAKACVAGEAELPDILRSGEGRNVLEALEREGVIEVVYEEDVSEGIVQGSAILLASGVVAALNPVFALLGLLGAMWRGSVAPPKRPARLRVIDKSVCECD